MIDAHQGSIFRLNMNSTGIALLDPAIKQDPLFEGINILLTYQHPALKSRWTNENGLPVILEISDIHACLHLPHWTFQDI